MARGTRGTNSPDDQNPLLIDPTLTIQNTNFIAESSQQPVNKPRRSSKSSTSKQNLSPERARHLERNRIAANKCRERRKQAQTHMEHSLETETARHHVLVAEVSALKEEIWRLKNQLLDHAQCDDHSVSSGMNGGAQRAMGDPLDPLKCPSPSFSVSTRSDESIVDPGIASKVSMDDKLTREFYGDGLFESFIDVPNI